MGEAFNTTTVALAAAMTTMFTLFLCERTDDGIDRFIDRFVEHNLQNRFVESSPRNSRRSWHSGIGQSGRVGTLRRRWTVSRDCSRRTANR